MTILQAYCVDYREGYEDNAVAFLREKVRGNFVVEAKAPVRAYDASLGTFFHLEWLVVIPTSKVMVQ